MFSAGQWNQPPVTGVPTTAATPGTTAPVYGPQTGFPVQGQVVPTNAFQFPSFAPIVLPTMAPSISLKDPKPDAIAALNNLVNTQNAPLIKQLDNQMGTAKLAMGLNVAGAALNTVASITNMVLNSQSIGRYYDYLNKVSDNARFVAVKQTEASEIWASNMLKAKQIEVDGSLRIADIDRNLKITLARIQEKGKTERAGLYVSKYPFSLNDYFNGNPSLALPR